MLFKAIPSRGISLIVMGVFAFIAAKGLWDLTSIFYIELQGPLHPDSLLYIELGKGILNGLTPYTDLLESKPPGIFLLSALSLFLTDGERLASVLQVVGFAIIPILFVVHAVHTSKQKSDPERKIITVIALFFGILIALYAERYAGTLQTEGFGGAYGALFIFLIALYRTRWTRIHTVLSSIFLLSSLGMKEPFLFSTFGASLLLVKNPRELVHMYFIPLCIACIAGILILIILGIFGPYTQEYLPLMVSKRISVDIVDPLWIRGFQIQRIYENMYTFSAPLFLYLVGALWICIPLFRTKVRSWKEIGLTVATGSTTFGLMYATFLVSRVLNLLEITLLFKIAAFTKVIFGFIAFVVLYAFLMFLLRRSNKHLFTHSVIAIGALFCMNIAVGAGGSYYNQHFIFALPILVALGFLFTEFLCKDDQPPVIPIIFVVLIPLTLLTYTSDQTHRSNLKKLLNNNAHSQQQLTQEFNTLMESCSFERYYAIGNKKFPFSTYSIVGPVFALQRYLQSDDPLLVQTEENIRSLADLIIIEENFEGDSFINLPKNFTTKQPECSSGKIPEGFSVLFRSDL